MPVKLGVVIGSNMGLWGTDRRLPGMVTQKVGGIDHGFPRIVAQDNGRERCEA
ncbi:MAG: hypothetical protein FD165_509 [Gammaproteobacteria bacterium]|nr:MAG: hypothetical protein FD165_509 [Gammaproteobacteria bacterium]TND02229.1 MAG: hypothetical protein FD120_2393 [Gammaproteobacteria bacterium]